MSQTPCRSRRDGGRRCAAHGPRQTAHSGSLDERVDLGQVLLMAAENRGPLMHAPIGMLQALNRHVKG